MDWFLLKEDRHKEHAEFCKGTASYVSASTDAFMSWMTAGTDSSGSMQMTATEAFSAFVRYSKSKRKNLLFVVNFTPIERPGLPGWGAEKRRKYKLILDGDARRVRRQWKEAS